MHISCFISTWQNLPKGKIAKIFYKYCLQIDFWSLQLANVALSHLSESAMS